jgi:gliding motility-associated-like protein
MCISKMHGQYLVNLVPNGSFENVIDCDSGLYIHNVHNAYPWIDLWNWHGELFNGCFPKKYGDTFSCSVPTNYFGHHYARTGKGYAGQWNADKPFSEISGREYLMVQLNRPLSNFKTYYGTYYVAAAYRPRGQLGYTASNRSGMAITDNLFVNDSVYGILIHYKPQIENDSNRLLNDTINWMPVGGSYNAHGGEQFITIGNFYDDAHTHVVSNLESTTVEQFIDDVSLVELPDSLIRPYTGRDTTVCPGQPVALGDSAELYTEHEHYSYKWTPATGLSADSISNPVAMPTVTTTYTCVKSLANAMHSAPATVTITVQRCYTDEEAGLWLPTAFTPNGDGRDDMFGALVNVPAAITQYSLIIYDRWGQRVFATTDVKTRWDGTVNGAPCPQAAYMYICTYNLNGHTVVKKGDVLLIR